MISIVIPSFNRAEVICRAVDSALAQTFPHREIIVVDDGSTDDTAARLLPYGDQLRLLQKGNGGKSSAVNVGVREAKGDWIAILDSDDRWLPDKLEFQMKALKRAGDAYGFCFTDAFYIGNSGGPQTVFERASKRFNQEIARIDNPVDYVLAPPHGIYEQTALIQKHLFKRCGEYDEQLQVGGDTDMIFRLATKTRFLCLNQTLVEIDRGDDRQDGLIDIYRKQQEVLLSERERMYGNWLGEFPLTPPQRGRVQNHLAEVHLGWANWHVLQGQQGAAGRSLAKADQLRPSLKTKMKQLLASYCSPLYRRMIKRKNSTQH